MIREFFLGFIRIHILYHASKEPVYGAWLMQELARHGYELSPGTLYPALHVLERDGYLSKEVRVIEGRQRKYYRITDRGQMVLVEARGRIAELVHEVLDEGADA
ncbi:MAG: PadR family transcriptional regulator [Chloroflexi bacterium B3_Chlor]|nr:MAG: PadR family transcriptional regulator [Chloroflexi bacterium B3_Chlor]